MVGYFTWGACEFHTRPNVNFFFKRYRCFLCLAPNISHLITVFVESGRVSGKHITIFLHHVGGVRNDKIAGLETHLSKSRGRKKIP